jgi:hypothetical protein
VKTGHHWILVDGKAVGETYEEVKDETEDIS